MITKTIEKHTPRVGCHSFHYENGDERIVVKFAWLPFQIQNQWGGFRIKWLEFVKIKRQYWDGKWYNGYYIDLF